MMRIELDEFDVEILDIVQRNNRLSAEKIAEKVCLSPSAVQRRLKRLRKDGVIEADKSIISPEALGHNLTLIVEITLENEHPATLQEFKQLILDTPQVMQCYYVTGIADFIIIMTTENIEEYHEFVRQHFSESPYIKRCQTSIVLQRIKSSTTVPLKLK